MTDESDAGIDRCAECGEKFDGDDLADVLDHYLNEHSRSEHFRDVLLEVVVERKCPECGCEFYSDVSVGEYADGSAVVTATSYCSTCTLQEPLHGIFCAEMSGRDVVEKEVLN